MRFERDLSPLQITLVYIVFAMVALLISDVLFVLWIDDPALLRHIVLTLASIPPDCEGLEPRFCRRWLHVAERI
jgi:hypothetical protein